MLFNTTYNTPKIIQCVHLKSGQRLCRAVFFSGFGFAAPPLLVEHSISRHCFTSKTSFPPPLSLLLLLLFCQSDPAEPVDGAAG